MCNKYKILFIALAGFLLIGCINSVYAGEGIRDPQAEEGNLVIKVVEDEKEGITFQIKRDVFAEEHYPEIINHIYETMVEVSNFDAEEVAYLLQEAQKNPKYKLFLAYRLIFRGSVPDDAVKALKLLKEVESMGNKTNYSNFYVFYGHLFYTDRLLSRNLQKARFWYEKAMENGDNEARFMLGIMYINGEGVVRDEETGATLLKKAATKGNKEAIYVVQKLSDTARYYAQNCWKKGNYKDAIRCATLSAELGNISVQYTLGQIYATGNHVTKDLERAAYWYRRVAENASSGEGKADLLEGLISANRPQTWQDIKGTAQYNLGVMYLNGMGIAQDTTEGLSWLKKAAGNGNRDALLGLARIYLKGLYGVTPDKTEAFAWVIKLANRGDAQGQYNAGIMYYRGIGTPQDKNAAVNWFLKAANQGYVDAMVVLAEMYAHGDGVPLDEEKAKEWLKKAEKAKK